MKRNYPPPEWGSNFEAFFVKDKPIKELSETDRELKALIRRSLPADAFKRRPWRVIRGVLLIISLLSGNLFLVLVPLPWPLALLVSIGLGNFYVTLMFFGHEVAHGTILRPGVTREAFQYFTLLIYLVSPHLWKYWHNCAHHPHANVPTLDPDCPRPITAERERKGLFVWLARRILPGSGHWLSFCG